MLLIRCQEQSIEADDTRLMFKAGKVYIYLVFDKVERNFPTASQAVLNHILAPVGCPIGCGLVLSLELKTFANSL